MVDLGSILGGPCSLELPNDSKAHIRVLGVSRNMGTPPIPQYIVTRGDSERAPLIVVTAVLNLHKCFGL